MPLLEFVLRSGRAVVYPIYQGTHGRGIDRSSVWPDTSRSYRDWVVQMVNDAQRTVDYLETRRDIQFDKLGYFAVSWGSSLGPVIQAVESRLKIGVWLLGGLYQAQMSPEVDPFNFAPRVSVPVLMINGDQDVLFPVRTSQEPLFTRLGTADDEKEWVRHPTGHADLALQRGNQIVRATLDWFDEHLGPVN